MNAQIEYVPHDALRKAGRLPDTSKPSKKGGTAMTAPVALATDLLDQFDAGDFAGAETRLDTRMTAAVRIAGSGPGSLAEYQQPGHVDAALIADIAAWISQPSAPR